MSIAKRVCESFEKLYQHDYESALIPASIAVAATAAQVYPPPIKDNVAYKTWIAKNVWLITKIGMGNIIMQNGIRFHWTTPGLKCDANGTCTLDEILYHVVRCKLVHAAKLPENITFGPMGTTKIDGNNNLTLTSGMIMGMLFAVVASPVNAAEIADKNYGFDFFGPEVFLNDLWGSVDKVLTLFPPELR